MKIKITYMISVILFCTLSCNENNTQKQEETPEVLQKDYDILSGFSKSYDLTEELYQEIVDRTPALQKLEEDIEVLIPEISEKENVFNEYDNRSTNYYSSARNRAEMISDSLLKAKINALILKSSQSYMNKTDDITSLLNKLSANTTTIRDLHLFLKISLTLTLIEKYQDKNLPDKKVFKILEKDQEHIIKQIKKTPDINF